MDHIGHQPVDQIAQDLGLKKKKVEEFLASRSIKAPGPDTQPVKPYLRILVLAVILTVALVIRVYPVVHSPETAKFGIGMFGDSAVYLRIGYNLYAGRGFSAVDDGSVIGQREPGFTPVFEPAVTRGPVYPFFIAAVYRLIGNPRDMLSSDTWHTNWDKIRIVQCVLDASVCLAVFFIVRAVFPQSFFPAWASSVLYCLSFYNIFYARALLSESLTTFLLAWSFCFLIRALGGGRGFAWVCSGVGFGLTILSRSEYILYVLGLTLFAVFVARRRWVPVSLKNVLIFACCAGLTVAPWAIRNYAIFKKPILVSIGGLGGNLFLGSYESAGNWKGWKELPVEIEGSPEERQAVESLYKVHVENTRSGSVQVQETDGALTKLALGRFRRDPWGMLGLWLRRIPRLWYQDYVQMYRDKEASGNFFIFYFICAAYALVRGGVRERVLMTPSALLFVYLTLLFLPMHIEPRYAVASMPCIISLAGIGVFRAISGFLKVA